ncbi:MAG: hypothetical protein IPM51_08575 [Sphingobacteriaceae bacterium]|nr:hypothetical protein [Sphingobacteriaceae bacterium]
MEVPYNEFRIDAWTICSFSVSIIGLIISFFLIFKKVDNRWPYILLAIYTLILSYQVFESALFWSRLIFVFPYLVNISGFLDLIATPILYLFYKTLFDFRVMKKGSLLHFLPFVIITGLNLPYFLLDGESKRLYFTEATSISKYFFTSMPLLITLQMLVYLIITYKTIKSQSNIGSVKKLSNIHLSLFSLIFISNTVYYVIIFFTSYNNPFIEHNATILLSAVVLLSGWFGLISPAVFNGLSIKDALISRQSYTESYDFKYDFLETYKSNSKSIKPLTNNYNSTIYVRATIENTLESNSPSNTICM